MALNFDAKHQVILRILADNAGKWLRNRELWEETKRRAPMGSPVVPVPHLVCHSLRRAGLVVISTAKPGKIGINGDKITTITETGLEFARIYCRV